MTHDNAYSTAGLIIVLEVLGFVGTLLWRFFSYGFWDAIGAGVIYGLTISLLGAFAVFWLYSYSTKK